MTTPTHAHAAAATETWRRGASFLLVGALWGCSIAVIKQATETGSSSSSNKKQAQVGGGVWAGLRALIGTKVRGKQKGLRCKNKGRSTHLSLCFFLLLQAALAFLVNQSGSLVFYYLLGFCGRSHSPTVSSLPPSLPPSLLSCSLSPPNPHSDSFMHTTPNYTHIHTHMPDISLAVPLCNSLTFVFTALTSHLLGERVDNPLRAAAGVVLVLLGVSLCVASK